MWVGSLFFSFFLKIPPSLGHLPHLSLWLPLGISDPLLVPLPQAPRRPRGPPPGSALLERSSFLSALVPVLWLPNNNNVNNKHDLMFNSPSSTSLAHDSLCCPFPLQLHRARSEAGLDPLSYPSLYLWTVKYWFIFSTSMDVGNTTLPQHPSPPIAATPQLNPHQQHISTPPKAVWGTY